MTGKTFLKEHHAWGDAPVYRLADGSLEVHYHGQVYSDLEVLRAAILDEWRPHSWDGQALYCRMAAGQPF